MSYYKKGNRPWELNPFTPPLTIRRQCTEPHYVPGTVLSSLFPNLHLVVSPQSYWLTAASPVAQW